MIVHQCEIRVAAWQ